MKIKKVLKFLLPLLACATIGSSIALTQVSCANETKSQEQEITMKPEKINSLVDNFSTKFKNVVDYKMNGQNYKLGRASEIKKLILTELEIPEEKIWNFSFLKTNTYDSSTNSFTVNIYLNTNCYFPDSVVNNEIGQYPDNENNKYLATKEFLEFSVDSPFDTLLLDVYSKQELESEIQKIISNCEVEWEKEFSIDSNYSLSDDYTLSNAIYSTKSKFSLFGLNDVLVENIKLVQNNDSFQKCSMNVELSTLPWLLIENDNQILIKLYFDNVNYQLNYVDFDTFYYQLKKELIDSNCIMSNNIDEFYNSIRLAEESFNKKYQKTYGYVYIGISYDPVYPEFTRVSCYLEPNRKIVNFKENSFFEEGFYRNWLEIVGLLEKPSNTNN